MVGFFVGARVVGILVGFFIGACLVGIMVRFCINARAVGIVGCETGLPDFNFPLESVGIGFVVIVGETDSTGATNIGRASLT